LEIRVKIRVGAGTGTYPRRDSVTSLYVSVPKSQPE